jgi:hypothetical protein
MDVRELTKRRHLVSWLAYYDKLKGSRHLDHHPFGATVGLSFANLDKLRETRPPWIVSTHVSNL